ncbi:MAG: AAA family ATPase [Candidatus Dojkabacteria bacterium]|nr:AAA family ATPase [Candidatus Dojkabacteria bacterium]
MQNSVSGFDFNEEIRSLIQKVRSVKDMPSGLVEKCENLILRLIKMIKIGNFSVEFESISEYINVVSSIPWGKYTEERLDIQLTKDELEKNHYGLDAVKTRLLEYLAVVKLQKAKEQNLQITEIQDTQASSTKRDFYSEMSKLQGSSSHAPVLCFVGIQGVGKTSMAKSMANALNRKFIRIALGGLSSVNEIRGVSRTLPNAEPGQIIKALIRAQSMNPLILLDEIDKVSIQTGARADVMAALLEILDPEQNSTFVDRYIDYPIDLSNCMFIATANNLGGISAALLDRLEVIRFGSYSDQDKIMIAKNYLLPKVRTATGLTKEQLDFDEDVWPLVIRPLGFDAGVRQLERTLTELARKVALQIVMGQTQGIKISKDNFRDFIPEDIGIYS